VGGRNRRWIVSRVECSVGWWTKVGGRRVLHQGRVGISLCCARNGGSWVLELRRRGFVGGMNCWCWTGGWSLSVWWRFHDRSWHKRLLSVTEDRRTSPGRSSSGARGVSSEPEGVASFPRQMCWRSRYQPRWSWSCRQLVGLPGL